MSIRLRFVSGGAWDSRLIRWATHSRWSHVEYMLDDTHTVGAMFSGGVAIRTLDDPNYKNAEAFQIVELKCTPVQEALYRLRQLAKVGKPYDWRAIVRLVFGFGLSHRQWREPDSWFCSETEADDLVGVGLVYLPSDLPFNLIYPRDVWMLTAGMKA